jgi:hypothetical protein
MIPVGPSYLVAFRYGVGPTGTGAFGVAINRANLVYHIYNIARIKM